jgi:hypothetical protein
LGVALLESEMGRSRLKKPDLAHGYRPGWTRIRGLAPIAFRDLDEDELASLYAERKIRLGRSRPGGRVWVRKRSHTVARGSGGQELTLEEFLEELHSHTNEDGEQLLKLRRSVAYEDYIVVVWTEAGRAGWKERKNAVAIS